MKKMSFFAMMALLVLGIASVAQAADIKATGKWQIEAQYNNALQFEETTKANSFHIEQRMRTAFQFIANENLKGVLDTQIGTAAWGSGLYTVGAGRAPSTTAGSASAAGAGNIMLRQGYIDFKWPGTKVNAKVGFQTLSLPAAFGGGSAILDDQIAAAVVLVPVNDNVKVLAGYARPYDGNTFGTTSATSGNAGADAIFAAVPVDIKGFNITPFGMFAYAGKNAGGAGAGATTLAGLTSAGVSSTSTEGMRGYWAGAAFTMTAFDPFKLMADFNYGKATYKNYGLTNPSDGGRSGFLFDIALDYTGLSMMTPELFYAYSSGEGGKNPNQSGRMPVINKPQSWSVGSFFFGDRNLINGGFATTGTGSSINGYESQVAGFWTLGLSLKDIKGTNHVDYLKGAGDFRPGSTYGAMLTTKDHLWEVDFNTKYKIYNELSAYLGLGYINASIDKDTWKFRNAAYGESSNLNGSAYHINLGLTYAF